ncbi:PHD finger protein At1g33420-like [Asparagus officinalis]|uniref:PHD finger protein At1g33420-like n=1 Tax=Asparagus officinalis TaxID=4686 RepID=UPI00098E038F|nr:PHD finger protein At1g33420-like [Asparagus officinalis]
MQSSDLRCTSCNYMLTVADLDYRTYLKLQESTHLMHGLVHSNGYGHLLRVNGREGGSQSITGSDIMGFWDHLCMMLQVREITVMDVSKKYGMEYRLLHTVTNGHPWYGEWGYQFGAGCFALTGEARNSSVENLSNIPLSLFFSHARSSRTRLQSTISLYQSLSDCQLLTVRDLFCFVTKLLHDDHGQERAQNTEGKVQSEAHQGVLCAWTKSDVERAEDVLIKVLQSISGYQWISWRALRGATCRAVGSPELLDYCLKGLGGRIINGTLVVAVRCNPETCCIEYRLEADSKQLGHANDPRRPSRDHLLHDLRFLYDALLNPSTMEHYKPEGRRETALNSAITLLDCKQLVKRYDEVGCSPSKLRIWCNVELASEQNGNSALPPELLVLPKNATISSLKKEATKAFQETYLIFQRLQVVQLLGFEKIDHSTSVALILGLSGTVKVRVRCLGVDHKLEDFRMERGVENWEVDCICGAKDDDGERMLECDSCGIWQHTRCNGIKDHKDAPKTFFCIKCRIVEIRDQDSGSTHGCDNVRKYTTNISPNSTCKDKIALASPEAGTVSCSSGVSCRSCCTSVAISCSSSSSVSCSSVCKDEVTVMSSIIKSSSIVKSRGQDSESSGGCDSGRKYTNDIYQRFACKDKIASASTEACSTFHTSSCKYEVAVMSSIEGGSLMCTIAVMCPRSVEHEHGYGKHRTWIRELRWSVLNLILGYGEASGMRNSIIE